jgi:hypothetical protein
MWMRNAGIMDKMQMKDAATYCKELKLGGFSDWRIPTFEEMKILLKGFPEGSDWRIILEKKGFSNIKDIYWTSTSYGIGNNTTKIVEMENGKYGEINSYNFISCYCIPVRSITPEN